jgi:hypothetical protein
MEAIAKVPDIQPLELMTQLLEIVKSEMSLGSQQAAHIQKCMLEKVAQQSMLADPAPAEFYRAWCRAACVRDVASPQQPTLALVANPQVRMSVEVLQFAEQKLARVFNFLGTRQRAQLQPPVGAGTLHEILLRLVEKQGGQAHQAPPSTKGLCESEKRLLAMWNVFKVAEWLDQAPPVFKQVELEGKS